MPSNLFNWLSYSAVTLHNRLSYAAVSLHTRLSYSAVTLHTLLSYSAVTLHILLSYSAITLHNRLSHATVTLHTLLSYSAVTLHTLLSYAAVSLHTLLSYSAVSLHTLLSYTSVTLYALLSHTAVTLHALLSYSAVTLHALLSYTAVTLHTLLSYAAVTLHTPLPSILETLLPFTSEIRISSNAVTMSSTVPVPVSFPCTPIAIKILLWYPLIIPRLSSPSIMPVIISPTRIKISVKNWLSPVITPTSVIVMGSVPMSIPRTPPPSAGEEYLFLHIRYGIDIRIRYWHHLGRRRKINRRRQGILAV
jgi:hypothetical protein